MGREKGKKEKGGVTDRQTVIHVIQIHYCLSSCSYILSLSLTRTNIHTLFSLNSNINFSFLRSCGAFKPSEVISRSNFQAKDTSSFAENQLFIKTRLFKFSGRRVVFKSGNIRSEKEHT